MVSEVREVISFHIYVYIYISCHLKEENRSERGF